MDSSFWDGKYSTEEYVYTTVVNTFVKEHLEDLPVGKLIDLAGGEGRNSVFFAEKGWMVENIDFSKVALDKFMHLADERGVAANCIPTRADATDFVSQLAPVDVGIIAYLQIPEEQLRVAIGRLFENIASGGVFFGVWHARENLEGGFGGPQNPKVLPTVNLLLDILEYLPVEVEVLTNRDGQVKTKDGLKPSITLTCVARKL